MQQAQREPLLPVRARIALAVVCTAVVLVVLRAGGILVVLPAAATAWGVWFATRAPWRPLAPAYVLSCAALFLVAANGVRFGSRMTFSDFLFGLALVALAAGLARHGRGHVPHVPPWLLAGTGILIASAIVAQLFAPDPLPRSVLFEISRSTTLSGDEPNLEYAARMLAAVVVMPVLLAAVCTSAERLRGLATAWVAGTTFSAFTAVLAAFTPIDLQLLTGARFTGAFEPSLTALRYTGLTVQPNHLATSAVLVLPIVFARLSARPRTYTAVTIVLVGGVILSGSRSGLIGLVLALAAFAVLHPRSRRLLGALGAAGAVAAIPILLFTDIAIKQRLGFGSNAASASNDRHSEAVRAAWRLFLDEPLTGYGFQVVRGAHNLTLQLLTGGGVLALVGFLIVAQGVARLGVGLARDRTLAPDRRELAVGLLLSLGLFLSISLVTNVIFDRYLYVPVGLLLGLAAIAAGERHSGRPGAWLVSNGADAEHTEQARPAAGDAPHPVRA